jgi:hypothetical protein
MKNKGFSQNNMLADHFLHSPKKHNNSKRFIKYLRYSKSRRDRTLLTADSALLYLRLRTQEKFSPAEATQSHKVSFLRDYTNNMTYYHFILLMAQIRGC